MGVVTLWKPPSMWAGITIDDSIRAQQALSDGTWRVDVRARNWAGKAVAKTLDWDDADDGVKLQIKAMLKAWVTSDALRIVTREDENRHKRDYYEVGKWIER
jgi:hypothetical protein